MSSSSRGRAAEDKARAILEDQGYHVHQALQRIRMTWSPEENDVVGAVPVEVDA